MQPPPVVKRVQVALTPASFLMAMISDARLRQDIKPVRQSDFQAEFKTANEQFIILLDADGTWQVRANMEILEVKK